MMLVQSIQSPKTPLANFVIGGSTSNVLDGKTDHSELVDYSRAKTAGSRGSSTPGSAKLLLKISHSQGNISSPLHPENHNEFGALSSNTLQVTTRTAALQPGNLGELSSQTTSALHLTAGNSVLGHAGITGAATLQHTTSYDPRLGATDVLPSINSCRVGSGKSVSSVHSIRLDAADILRSAGCSSGTPTMRVPSATLRLKSLLCNAQTKTRPVSSHFSITHVDVPKASNLLRKLRVDSDTDSTLGTGGYLQDEIQVAKTVLQREDSGYSEPLSNRSADTEENVSRTGSRKSRPKSRRKKRREKSSRVRQGLKVIGNKAPTKLNQIKFSPRNSETINTNNNRAVPSPRGPKRENTMNFQVYCKPIQTLPPSYRPPKPEKPAVIRQSDIKSQNLLTLGHANTVYTSTGGSSTLSFSLSKSWGSMQSGNTPAGSPRRSVNENQLNKVVKIYLSEKQSENIVEAGGVVPCAPPASPTPEHLLSHKYVPSMSDNVAQRAMKGRLEVLEKKQKKKELQKEVEKDKMMKQLLKEQEKEKRKKQRQEIYALNKVMTNLEFSNFLAFCKLKGINIETEDTDSEKKHSGKRRKKSAKKSKSSDRGTDLPLSSLVDG
ncbi:uncharacterized protein LOC106165526 [Lingula anatina]|uniref:Small vasohibin-binding protein n=1 Tax=Lingula anatina TaxID=7574 RepID=A0A1S3ILS0_LINAN|nr:uncharacterized protein LOC106165526 [Lingula anatina]|eukprot:XP_013399190.2 uncharacterized protein LOC106165526 [Lingula anatina]